MATWHLVEAADVRLEAARILGSDDLRRARKLRELLAFLVDQWIAFGDRPISQQRLAEDVLGKDHRFSVITNAHVRIYLRRLRQSLAAYYAAAGASDPIVLGVTSGAYRLSVTRRGSANRAAGLRGRPLRPAVRRAAGQSAKPAALMLTTELSARGLHGSLKRLPALVPRALTQHLLGKDGLVAIGPVLRDQISDPPCRSPVARQSAAQYLLEGTLDVGSRRAGGKQPLEIVVRLHEIESGKHIWSRSCTELVDSRDPVSAAEVVAARLAATILAGRN